MFCECNFPVPVATLLHSHLPIEVVVMAENKTKPTKVSVTKFIAPRGRQDTRQIIFYCDGLEGTDVEAPPLSVSVCITTHMSRVELTRRVFCGLALAQRI